MTLIDYLQKPDAKRVLLVEITSGTTTWYVSDDPYETNPTDTPSSLPFTPLVGGSGLPSYSTSLDSALAPRASASTGNLSLIDTQAMSLVSGAAPLFRSMLNIKRGATITFKLTAPRLLFPYTDAITLFTAVVRGIGGNDEGGLEISTTAASRILFDSYTPTERGVYGRCSNIELKLKDFQQQIYVSHDFQGTNYGSGTYGTNPYVSGISGSYLQAVTAVYDDGVLLSPSQYTVNNTVGLITLNSQPAGTLTADIDGLAVSNTWLQSTREITQYLASPYLLTGNYGIIADRIGYFHSEKKFISEVFDEMALGAAAFWFVDDFGLLRFKEWKAPTTHDFTFTFAEMLFYSFETIDEIYNRQEITYKKNFHVIPNPREGANFLRANYVTLEGERYVETATTDGATGNPAPIIDSYFEALASATNTANRVLTWLKNTRFRYRFEVPLMQAVELGSAIQIQTNEGNKVGICIARSIKYDGGAPTQEIEIIV